MISAAKFWLLDVKIICFYCRMAERMVLSVFEEKGRWKI